MIAESLLVRLQRDVVGRVPDGRRVACQSLRRWARASHQGGSKAHPERGVAALVLDARAADALCGGCPDGGPWCGAAVCGAPSRPFVEDCQRLRTLGYDGDVFDAAQIQSTGRVGSLQRGACCPRRPIRVSGGKESRAASACSRA